MPALIDDIVDNITSDQDVDLTNVVSYYVSNTGTVRLRLGWKRDNFKGALLLEPGETQPFPGFPGGTRSGKVKVIFENTTYPEGGEVKKQATVLRTIATPTC